ncbi:spore coat protein [Domibacillus indicus]|uniref:spore coat protein n=1 Tax=Domibacillus indicus TaxID=1437523 RepID=UPI000AC13126|nr:spore coat protein [Domibacillus indicus]
MAKYSDEHKHKCQCKKCERKSRQDVQDAEEMRVLEDMRDDAEVLQPGTQASIIDQESDELVWIKDSCNIDVQSTDTQAAVSLQVGLQLAIALVISITIGDSDEGQTVAQDLFQYLDADQTNKQRILIDNSKDVTVTTTDTDLSVNIQALLEVLVALVVRLDVL